MFRRTSLFSLSLLLCLFQASPAKATGWENLFNATSGESKASVDMKSSSFKKRLLPGEKIISAHLWMFYQTEGTSVQARGDYEVYCATRKVFRSNLNMKTEDVNRTQSTVNVLHKTKLEGKDYQDFLGIMDLLCKR